MSRRAGRALRSGPRVGSSLNRRRRRPPPGRGDRRCFWSAAKRCSTSSSRARPDRRRRPTRRAPGARRSTWRSAWRGWSRTSGLLTGLSSDLLGQRLRAGAGGRGGLDRATPSRPTGRRRSAWSGSMPRGCRPTSSTTTARPTPASRAADLPALGPEVVGLHFGSYSLAAAPVGDAMAALARGKGGRFVSLDPNVRPTVEPDMDVWRARLAVLFPLADLVKISAEDLELLWPGMPAESLRRRPDRPGRRARGGDRRRRGGARLDRRRAACDGDAAAGEGHRHRRAPATPSRRRCSRGCCAIPRGRRRRSPGWTRRGSRRSSTMPRGPRRSPARGAAPTCRAPPS